MTSAGWTLGAALIFMGSIAGCAASEADGADPAEENAEVTTEALGDNHYLTDSCTVRRPRMEDRANQSCRRLHGNGKPWAIVTSYHDGLCGSWDGAHGALSTEIHFHCSSRRP